MLPLRIIGCRHNGQGTPLAGRLRRRGAQGLDGGSQRRLLSTRMPKDTSNALPNDAKGMHVFDDMSDAMCERRNSQSPKRNKMEVRARANLDKGEQQSEVKVARPANKLHVSARFTGTIIAVLTSKGNIMHARCAVLCLITSIGPILSKFVIRAIFITSSPQSLYPSLCHGMHSPCANTSRASPLLAFAPPSQQEMTNAGP